MKIELSQRVAVETVRNAGELRIVERDRNGTEVKDIQFSGADVPRLIAALTACLVDLGE